MLTQSGRMSSKRTTVLPDHNHFSPLRYRRHGTVAGIKKRNINDADSHSTTDYRHSDLYLSPDARSTIADNEPSARANIQQGELDSRAGIPSDAL
jgi:hypothetical protein